MGNKMELLKSSYELLLEADEVLRSNFDYESILENSFIDEDQEVIFTKDTFGKYIQYDISDCYTPLIKALKTYRCKEISDIYKELKKISIEAEIFC
ncbi:hypothetical protein K1514_15265 [Paraclostridium bifermentans]|uniref:hypothetical protein n=1 Tax=Paraclostridium TaxID=1849822 RepID=UPI0019D4A796|nr:MULTISPECIES: hypothetical protein [Paraclostridium]MBN8046759.1 hypothetical protein [Paraclostridium bifermentans]MBZ6007252.1 hypothetical protein [Paraclostridium bifermentans]MDU0295859.1 hypothetical protein [Paraclostridium sp. MRS3W1]